MKLGADDAFEQPHGLLDETRLLLGRIGAGGDRCIDMHGNPYRRAADRPARNCHLLHLLGRERGSRNRYTNERHGRTPNLATGGAVPAIWVLPIGKKNEYICTYGHGRLNVAEVQISGSENPEWTPQANDIWSELAGAGNAGGKEDRPK